MIWILAALLAQEDVCHVDLKNFDVKAPIEQPVTVATGTVSNLSDLELAGVLVEVSLYNEDGAPIKALPPATYAKIPARAGMGFKAELVEALSFYSYRVKVTYRIEGKERAFEFEDGKLKNGKLYEEPSGGVKLGIAGTTVVPAAWRMVGQKSVSSGETLFVRLLVEGLPEKGRPEGMFEITLYLAGKKQGVLKRKVESKHWKLDAKDMPPWDADPSIVCFDPKNNELYIGLCRLENNYFNAEEQVSFDAKFTWKKQTWKWTDIKKPWSSPPKPPEKPEKK